MALDNANFISELSIVDPPGTDPLSQGDDQIRTIKRATQQSFPNIDAAVLLTPVQLNLAAIKNEANVFTTTQEIQNASLLINAATDANRSILWQAGGLNVWAWSLRNAAGGLDFHLQRYDALGSFVENAMAVDFATGVIDFLQVPTVQGAPIWIAGELRMFVANTTPGTNWFVANGLNGTVNLDDRILMSQGASGAGTNLAPNLIGTAGTGTTDSTAISEAQMPAHDHALLVANDGTVEHLLRNFPDQAIFGVRNSATDQFSKLTGGGQVMMDDAGSTQGHTHGQNAVGVTENGTSRDVVRPLSRTVQYHQYVP